MGCFHHILPRHREEFIEGVSRTLTPGGHYFMECFSQKNGPAWNHFTEQGIRRLFSPSFDIEAIEQLSSLEGDGVVRHFHACLMEAKI